MKKWLSIALVAVLCLLLAGCGVDEPVTENAVTTTAATTTTTTATTTTITTTATAATSTVTQDFLISEAEALELVQQHLGIYNGDHDPQTGFLMSWMLEESPTVEKPLYVFILRWLVETDGEPSHFSTINWLSVDAYTGTIIA